MPDANGLIRGLDAGELGALDNALAGRAPVIAATAAGEYLRKGDPTKLADFLASRGGRVVADAHPAAAAALMRQAAGMGRSLKRGDATIAATAIREGLPIITRDRRFSRFLSAIGRPVESF